MARRSARSRSKRIARGFLKTAPILLVFIADNIFRGDGIFGKRKELSRITPAARQRQDIEDERLPEAVTFVRRVLLADILNLAQVDHLLQDVLPLLLVLEFSRRKRKIVVRHRLPGAI